ncbi:zinc dependent phospholipase C family protein [Pontibacillus litoralis]|uniref:Phospholipase C/D domain-containing protein n=1 Tax=Pontibacillus litoralis JSM 072002 TaxID=1385512 RepID=A0A0A5FZS7_9BACI|nr:zinc dependent phospholipase C family protein [Pontibacillus litoralis]KGX85299.1 hypothetical protein N784_09670 [Pontibacillus litoralis JSM 072002]
MPNIWTHILFCEDVMDSINAPQQLNAVQPYLNLGAQGPDPFFYHNFLPWQKDTRVHEIGNALHYRHCGPFLISLIEEAANQSDETKAYVTGFVTHHILDRNTHPFINYFAGYEKNKHQAFEVIIDTIMMQRYRHMKTWKSPVYKEINVGSTLDKEIEELLNKLIAFYYPDEHKNVPTNYIKASYKDMKQALHILFDPYGWKNALLGSLVSSFSHQPIKKELDYLNEQHRTWHHSATNEEQTESFLDLYEQARAEGIEVIDELCRYWRAPTTNKKNTLTLLIDNRCYDTGKPLHLNLKNQYCNPII